MSSAATTSASASSRASLGDASSTRPIGVAASTSVPGISAMRPIMSGPARTVPDVTSTPTLPTREQAGLSSDASGRRVPTAWERARRRVDLEDPVVGWTATIGLTLLSLFLRLWKLGTPKVFEFDETYYAKDAWSLLHYGYARGYVDGANEQILDGKTSGQWTDGPSMIVHPEAGKWLIALGEKAFGMDPFGWRIAAAVIGSLMVLVMCRLARRMTGSTAARPGRRAAAQPRRPAVRPRAQRGRCRGLGSRAADAPRCPHSISGANLGAQASMPSLCTGARPSSTSSTFSCDTA